MKVKSDTKVKIGNEGRVTFRNKLEETTNTFGQRFIFFKVIIDETGNVIC